MVKIVNIHQTNMAIPTLLYSLPNNKMIIIIIIIIIVGSQIVAHTLTETGNGPNRPNTINL